MVFEYVHFCSILMLSSNMTVQFEMDMYVDVTNRNLYSKFQIIEYNYYQEFGYHANIEDMSKTCYSPEEWYFNFASTLLQSLYIFLPSEVE